MRCYVTLAQTFAELETHECTRGIARGRAVVTLFQVGDHREVGVTYGGGQVKTVLGCAQRHRLADSPALPLAHRAHKIAIPRRLALQSFEVDQRRISLAR